MYVERTNASLIVKDSHAWNVCNINKRNVREIPETSTKVNNMGRY